MSDKLKPIRCLLDVRGIPLEFFRHPNDGKKWRQPARHRSDLLLRLATYANPDGSLGSYSPSIQTLSKHFAERTLYLHLNDLRELGFLTWVRNKNYYRREYQILLPEAVRKHLQDSGKKHLQDSQESPARLEKTPATVAKTPATATQYIRPLSEEPSKEREETSLSDSGKQNGSASRTDRERLADEYFIWLSNAYRVSFGKQNKADLRSFIVGCSHNLAALKQGTARILDELDLTSSYTHADNRLVASLPDACLAAIQESEEKQRKAAMMAQQTERQTEHLRQKAAIEAAELETRLAGEAELEKDALLDLMGDREPAALSV
jgi:hypothetical protein